MSTTDSQRYAHAMRFGHAGVLIAIEQEHGLFGYPPELVSVGLQAIERGEEPHAAIEEYTKDPDHA